MDNRKIIQRSLDYIEDNLQTELTAGELAEMAGFSLFHYYRLFQQATGLPGQQMVSHRFDNGDGRLVGEIIGQLHLALEKIDDCVNEADLLATLRDWALPKQRKH